MNQNKRRTTKSTNSPIAVLGAGSWGTTLALLLARQGQETRLWSHRKAHAETMQQTQCNATYLPDQPFPSNLSIYHNLSLCLQNTKDIFIVVPSFAFTEVLKKAKPDINENHRIAWGTKGLSPEGTLLHNVVKQELQDEHRPIAILSGPSLAKEVAAGLPTAITLSSNDLNFATHLTKRLHSEQFRIYLNDDIIGVEICSIVKNILAIATGISDGLKLGANARSALITRGLTEMKRLCKAAGGNETTVMGLAGLGDLILTCTDDRSRNRRFGLALGAGKHKTEAEKEIGQAIEGLYNINQIFHMSQIYHIDMPITEEAYKILNDNLNPQTAVNSLLNRSLKSEDTF